MGQFKKEVANMIKDAEGKIQNFGDLIDSMETIESKKKFLFKQIYSNAVEDRENSYNSFSSALEEIEKDPATQHSLIGGVLAKYLERMSRANDQLIKLAEMISQEIEQQNRIDPDDIYSQMQPNKKI